MRLSQAPIAEFNQVLRAVKRCGYIVAAVLAVVPAAIPQTSLSKSAVAYYNRGVESYKKHDYDKAIEDFSAAITFDPGFAWAYDNRGIARFEKLDVDGAIDDFTRALELDPLLVGAYVNRGKARECKGEPRRGARGLQSSRGACSIQPDSILQSRKHLERPQQSFQRSG